jgi:hypothetical protein
MRISTAQPWLLALYLLSQVEKTKVEEQKHIGMLALEKFVALVRWLDLVRTLERTNCYPFFEL